MKDTPVQQYSVREDGYSSTNIFSLEGYSSAKIFSQEGNASTKISVENIQSVKDIAAQQY